MPAELHRRPAAEQIIWTAAAWSDYVDWQRQDRKGLKRINALILDAMRNSFEGIGKPEPLRENLRVFGHAASTT